MSWSLDTLLATPRGWTTVQLLTADEVLFDELGYPCKIASLSAPYEAECAELSIGRARSKNPQGSIVCTWETELFSINNGRWEKLRELKAGGNAPRQQNYAWDQLPGLPENWPVWTVAELPVKPGYDYKVRGVKPTPIAAAHSVAEVQETLTKVRKHGKRGHEVILDHHVPITFPLQTAQVKPALDPWLMGVVNNYWDPVLGQLKSNLEFLEFYLGAWRRAGFEVEVLRERTRRSPAHTLFPYRVEGLADLLDKMRYRHPQLPPEYLRASVKDRLALLAGLMDKYNSATSLTRGKMTVTWQCKDRHLVKQVAELVRSLGWSALIYHRDRPEKGYEKSWYVMWHPEINPFSHPKLQMRWQWQTWRKGSQLERYTWRVLDVQDAGRRLVRDVDVESPHGLFAVGKLFLPMKGDAHGEAIV